MPTAVWTGSLSIGLVVVPVRLYPAIHKRTVRFHELDQGGRRVRHVRVSEPDEFETGDRGPVQHPPEPMSGRGLEPTPRGGAPERPSPIYESPSPPVAFDEIR